MIPRLLALIRDLSQAHPIATEQEEKWLKTLWAGHLSTQEGADDARRRLVRAGWWAAFLQPLLLAAFVAFLCWLTWR